MNRHVANPAARPTGRHHPTSSASRGAPPVPPSLTPAASDPTAHDRDGDGEEDDDDYMSAAFLADTAAAISSASSSSITYSQRRKLALQAQSRPPPGSALSMQEKRNEGLKRKLDESNKGMSLLQRMGWKEGAALGKTNQGIFEPLAPTVHRGRVGIGIKTAEEEAEEQEAKRVRLLQGKEDEFRDWRAAKFAERQIENDVRKARKICFQVDSAKEITCFSHFWPLSLQPPPPPDHVAPLSEPTPTLAPNPDEIDLAIDDNNSDEAKDSESEPDSTEPLPDDTSLWRLEQLPDLASLDNPLANELAPSTTNPDEIEPWTPESKAFEALEPPQQLSQLISTLRERHTYCLYCGCTFTSEQEMKEVCPGLTREDH